MNSELALLGGLKAVTFEQGDVFTWPIVTEQHERAVLDVLRGGRMSGLDVTAAFEKRYPVTVGHVGEAETRMFMACDLREFGLAALREDPAPLFRERPDDEFMVWHREVVSGAPG